MSDIKVTPTAEADPAATSIQNDKTVEQTSNPDQTTELSAAPTTSEDAVMAEAKTEEQNEKKEETAEAKPETKTEEGTTIHRAQSTCATADKSSASKPAENQGEKRGGRPQGAGRNTKRVRPNYDELPESSDPDEIRRQVEFYFSDSNLPTDNYLLKQTGGHKNLPVDLKVIHNFKRMRHFQPYSAVLEACKASTVIDVTDDGQITRKEPISDKFSDNVDENRKMLENQTMARSIYAKGFGEEKPTSQTDIEEFFSVYGTFNAVRLRRTNNGEFKGSVFVEFSDEKTAEDFLKLDPKPAFQGSELSIKSKKAYVDEKLEGIKNGTITPNDNWKERRDNDQRGGRGGRGGNRGRGGRGRGGNGRGRGGGRGGRGDREDRPNTRNAEREDRKRGREDEGQQGEAKKTKTEE
ncbi:hypothetical protein E4T48_00675 [Aureobasidium sp. EXF-10727]|nr:hypothetical protein E4T48_00675 [Aureobasidium sp. EXF-10727]